MSQMVGRNWWIIIIALIALIILIPLVYFFYSLVVEKYFFQIFGGIEEEIPSWGRASILFILLGTVITIGGAYLARYWGRGGKYIAIFGVFLIFIGIFGIEILFAARFIGKPDPLIKECKNISTTNEISKNLIVTGSCIIIGYAPKDLEITTIGSFLIFALILPLSLIIALFYEFIDFLTNENVRRVVVFASALIAYRGLLASMFVELLSYSFAGVALLAINYLLFGIIYRAISGIWKLTERMRMIGKAIIRGQDVDYIQQLLTRREQILKALANPSLSNQERRTLRNELDYINNELRRLGII